MAISRLLNIENFTSADSLHKLVLAVICFRRSLLLNVGDDRKPQISMVPFNEPSSLRPAASMDVANFEREELVQQYVSKSEFLNCKRGYSFSFVIFSILLQLEIIILPLGATLLDKGRDGYPLIIDNYVQYHNWKRSTDAFTRTQLRRSSDYRSNSNSITSTSILNSTLLGNEITFNKWKHTKDISDDQSQQYQSGQFVLFTFIVIHNSQTKLFTTESPQIFVIELQPQEGVTVTCRASLLGLGEDMDVMWWKDDEFVTTANSTLILDDQNSGLYRCVADVAIVSTDLLDSYLSNNRIKRSAEMPPGKVLSNAFIVKRAIPVHFIVHPKNLTVARDSVFRLECATSGSLFEPIIWYQNDTEILVEASTEDKVHIYTIEHQSILHLIGADLNNSGHYRCRSGRIFSDIAIVNVTFGEDENSTKSSAMLTDLPSESLIPVGESVILECLSGDPQSTSAWHVVNEYGQPIRKYQKDDVKTQSAVIIRSANTQDNGKYTCITSGKTVQKTISTFITVQVAPLLLAKRLVRRITGTLGTTIRLRCSGSVEPHDTSFQINWYKDGKKVIPFGRAKVVFIFFKLFCEF
uniref:Ig-like domain-containing protein n=1 Tax=Onchocerca volvulus TaxID=6282 RepID=A0A8R1XWH6_ONCVO